MCVRVHSRNKNKLIIISPTLEPRFRTNVVFFHNFFSHVFASKKKRTRFSRLLDTLVFLMAHTQDILYIFETIDSTKQSLGTSFVYSFANYTFYDNKNTNIKNLILYMTLFFVLKTFLKETFYCLCFTTLTMFVTSH